MSSFNNPSTNNNSFDSLLLQSLMGRLQLRPPYLNTNSYLSLSLEDFLLDANNNNDQNEDDDDDELNEDEEDERTLLSKEESKLEKDIIRVILSGKIDTLKPNSGQAVTIGEHHICVGFHYETDSDYRVWEWHGHIMLFDEENGYTPEYIYGNYFERVVVKPGTVRVAAASVVDEEEKAGNVGLRELIDGGDSNGGRILHRNINAGSPRFK